VPPTHQSDRALKAGGRLIAIHESARCSSRELLVGLRMNATNNDPSTERSQRRSYTRARIQAPCSKVSVAVSHRLNRAHSDGPRLSTRQLVPASAWNTWSRQGACVRVMQTK